MNPVNISIQLFFLILGFGLGFLFFVFSPVFSLTLLCFYEENDTIFQHYVHITIWQILLLHRHFNASIFKEDLCLSNRCYCFSHLILLVLLLTYTTNSLNLTHRYILLGRKIGVCLCVPVCKYECTNKQIYMCELFLVGACVL